MKHQSRLGYAARAVTACIFLTTTTQLQAQGGFFDPNIPEALPLGQAYKVYPAQQIQQPRFQPVPQQQTRQYRRPPVQQQFVPQNNVRFRQASYTSPQQRFTGQLHPPGGNNVWQRVFKTFNLADYSNNRRVQRFIRSYGNQPNQLSILSSRAAPFMHMIIEEVNRRGIPAEIALLPFVESGFKLDVFSHAGAAGLWQFIPSTGRNYGLKQTRSYDARMDPFAATNAALDYLQKLHREFRGDWLKALAAYNCGENCVHRAVRKARKAGRPTNYWNLSLPRETMNYVPRLLAFKELLGNARRYGIRLPATPNAQKLIQVELNKPVNLRQAALRAGLPAHKLTRLNPNFRSGVTMPRMSNRITLPSEHAGRLIQVLRTMPPA